MSELDLFAAAISIADPEGRASLLERECAGRPEVRQRIERLLDAHFQSNPMLDVPIDRTTDFVGTESGTSRIRLASDAEGMVIAGRYKLLQQIGEGGMGTVWMADQTEPVKRRVAVKLIRTQQGGSRTILSRFEAERQAIALMDHPHIAKLLDAGTTPDGAPFFVMELVKGVPLNDYCDEHKLGIRERLQLFTQICSAVQHAHQKGIIHRDLKPSNILVESHDGKPMPKVIDFGLAKATSGLQLSEGTLFTAFGSVMGTPMYMAPEQATFNAVDVDTRADVYALGVVLYELLTGTTPITRESMKKAALDEMLRLIREQEAPTPSSRLSGADTIPSVAANRQMEPRNLGRFVKGELDWIVMKALSKERDRRYETANGFARDVERFLNDEAVAAGPPSATYRLRKFARRNRGRVVAASLILACLVGGLAVSLWQMNRAVAAETLARNNERKARESESVAKAQRTRAEDREKQAIDAVKKFRDAVANEPELKNSPRLDGLRKRLLKEPLGFFRALRDRLQADKDTRPEALSKLAEATVELGQITEQIGDPRDAINIYREAAAIFGTLAEAHPAKVSYRNNLATSEAELGVLLARNGQIAEGERHFRAAITRLRKIVEDQPDDAQSLNALAATQSNFGELLESTGRSSEAEALYRDGIAFSRRVIERDASDVLARTDLAIQLQKLYSLLRGRGRLNEGREALRESQKIVTELLAKDPNNADFRLQLAHVFTGFANVSEAMGGSPSEAAVDFQKAMVIYQELVDANPTTTDFRRHLALCHWNLATAFRNTNNDAGAMDEYRLAIEQFQALSDEQPTDTSYRLYVQRAHADAAIILRNQGRFDEAEARQHQALAVAQALADQNPTVGAFRSGLAATHHGIGQVLYARDRWVEAEAEYRKAIAASEQAIGLDPSKPQFSAFLGNHRLNIGMTLLAMGRKAEAEAEYRKASEIYTRMAETDPATALYRNNLYVVQLCLAGLLADMGKPADAAVEYRKALALAPNERAAQSGLTEAEGLAAFEGAFSSLIAGGDTPTTDESKPALAFLCLGRGRYRTASRLYAEAFASHPELARDRGRPHRARAARAAAMASTGRGKGEPPADAATQAELRKQAIDWLRADLNAWKRVTMTVEPGNKEQAAQALHAWKVDPDLACIRDEAALANLQEEERGAFKTLWADVDGLLSRVGK